MSDEFDAAADAIDGATAGLRVRRTGIPWGDLSTLPGAVPIDPTTAIPSNGGALWINPRASEQPETPSMGDGRLLRDLNLMGQSAMGLGHVPEELVGLPVIKGLLGKALRR